MPLFNFRWLRRQVRKHTNPIPISTADKWKRKLSIIYALLAWNAFGLVMYQWYKGKADWATFHGVEKNPGTPAQQYAAILNVDNVKVKRISGFKVIDEYEIKKNADDDQQQ